MFGLDSGAGDSIKQTVRAYPFQPHSLLSRGSENRKPGISGKPPAVTCGYMSPVRLTYSVLLLYSKEQMDKAEARPREAKAHADRDGAYARKTKDRRRKIRRSNLALLQNADKEAGCVSVFFCFCLIGGLFCLEQE